MMDHLNVLIAGLGGQGVILTARILVEAAFLDGHEALNGDVVGATQRFGSACSFVRIGREIYSATFPAGEADLLLGLEPIQALKTAIYFANQKGVVIISERAMGMQAGSASEYPSIPEIVNELRSVGIENIRHFDAGEVAVRETGSILALNMVMLGAGYSSGLLPLRQDTAEAVIGDLSPKGTAEPNVKAFRAGIRYFEHC